MKKIAIFLSFLIGVQLLCAQTMTDEQVKNFVIEAQEKGISQQEIAKDLLSRGVSMDQVNRIKKEMQSKGQQKVENVVDDKLRMRTTSEDMENMQENKSTDEFDSEIEIFGHRIFQNKDVIFEASYNLPTPSDYRLGSGDQVAIDVWGASQSSLLKTISPDGNISVENLGPIHLSGLTVEQANNLLKQKFESIYAGLNDENPNSNIRLSLAQNRTIQVHVMGEVENPGTYAMSSFATIFNALYQAGGVNEVGTLRDVKVFRKDKMVATYDVYDFILNGRSNMGIRLEDNDIVVVDACKNLVNVTGAVKRAMYYEVLDGETVGQVLKYAGGLSENAYKEDVRIERSGKYEREILTVAKGQLANVNLQDGDVISVDMIAPTFSNMVEIQGAVYRPGKFQLSEQISTVKQLLECAGGLKDEAFLNRAILNRRKPNNTMENLAIDLKLLLDGSIADIPLRKNDVLLILEWSELNEMRTISVSGEVLFAGTYEYRDNMTIEDAVLGAGGLKESASSVRVLVARRPKNSYSTTELDSIAQLFELTLNEDLRISDGQPFMLCPFDEIVVRKSPGYNAQEKVKIEGEVLFSGTYVLPSKHTTLSQLVQMSGGCTSDAYPYSAKLYRLKSESERELDEKSFEAALEMATNQEDSLAIIEKHEKEAKTKEYSIAIDLAAALENPGSGVDILLQEGDRLVVPRKIDVVRVSGEVMVPNAISYREGMALKYYVNQSGGYTDSANKSKIYVVHANGDVEKVNRRSRAVYPGSEVVVSAKKKREGGMSAAQLVSLGSTASSLATVVLALMNVLK